MPGYLVLFAGLIICAFSSNIAVAEPLKGTKVCELEAASLKMPQRVYNYSKFLVMNGVEAQRTVYSNNGDNEFRQDLSILASAGVLEVAGKGLKIVSATSTQVRFETKQISGLLTCSDYSSIGYAFRIDGVLFDHKVRYWDVTNSYPTFVRAALRGNACIIGSLETAADHIADNDETLNALSAGIECSGLRVNEPNYECVEMEWGSDGEAHCVRYRPLPPLEYFIPVCDQ